MASSEYLDGGSNSAERAPSTAVAIDNDKYSQDAMKWAVDHLLVARSITLIHVKIRANPGNYRLSEAVSDPKRDQQLPSDLVKMFIPYRGICARQALKLKEVILEDFDVSRAILDYITENRIENIVIGASSKNTHTRKSKNPGVAACLIKSVPEFCAVHVIYKGMPLVVHKARIPPPLGTLPQALSMNRRNNQYQQAGHELDCSSIRNSERNPEYDKMSSRWRFLSREMSSKDPYPNTKSPNDSDVASMNVGVNLLELENYGARPQNCFPRVTLRETEDEMRNLKNELKQTKEMYNLVCKDAIMAKEKVKELQKLNMEEALKVEELRRAIEIEKAKSKAAMDAADAAKRIAELEAKRRQKAEMRAKQEAMERRRAVESMTSSDNRCRNYSIDEIKATTNFFSKDQKIGEGGYGPVFRATLDNTDVAIKVLGPGVSQGREQFLREVEILSCTRHPNMIMLLGACPEYGCLVYEYMDLGSLDDMLFRRGKIETPPMPWTTRFKIAAEVATALLFLHQTKPEPLVHRDLKPGNILLDRNYVSKISDVGLARMLPPSLAINITQCRLTATAGTFCYIDPEYQQTGMLGVKSDIYSLGVMLLQIITARPPMGLALKVEQAIESGTLEEVLDPAVPDWPVEDTLSYARLALKCTELRRKDRPDLKKVILPELNRLRSLGQTFEAARRVAADEIYQSTWEI